MVSATSPRFPAFPGSVALIVSLSMVLTSCRVFDQQAISFFEDVAHGVAGINSRDAIQRKEMTSPNASSMLTLFGKSWFSSSHCFPAATTINPTSSAAERSKSMVALTMREGTGTTWRNEKFFPLTPDSESTPLKPSLLVAAHESSFLGQLVRMLSLKIPSSSC